MDHDIQSSMSDFGTWIKFEVRSLSGSSQTSNFGFLESEHEPFLDGLEVLCPVSEHEPRARMIQGSKLPTYIFKVRSKPNTFIIYKILLAWGSYCQKDIIIQGRELKIPFWVHHDVVVHSAH